jgi:hypothetical protein
MILRMDLVLIFENLRLDDERRKKTFPMKVEDSMCANTDGFCDFDVFFFHLILVHFFVLYHTFVLFPE